MKRRRSASLSTYQEYDHAPAVSRNSEAYPYSGTGGKLQSRRVLTIDDGGYRVFVSVYKGGQQLTFGFPKEYCRNQKVWVGRDSELVCWLSITDARANLGSLFKSQCLPVLAQVGECSKVIAAWRSPVVMAKRLLGAYKKV